MTQEPSGVLLVNKHAGVTSHDIVGKVRRLYNTRRVGHAGTLDPMATGLLVVLVGRAAKASEYLVSDSKHYRAGLRLGITTDTEDVTGQVLTTCHEIPTYEALLEVLPSFRGEIMQTPPMYSALKVGGKKLVDLAREGVVIERKARPIEIYSLDAAPTVDPAEYKLEVTCSGGTYIRTLCADIGSQLGCGGAMSALERTEACGFSLQNAYTVAQLEQMESEDRVSRLIPIESLFSTLPCVHLPAFYEKLCRSGCEIYLSRIKADLAEGTRVRIADTKGAFFALGEVRAYPEGLAVKAIKMFSLE